MSDREWRSTTPGVFVCAACPHALLNQQPALPPDTVYLTPIRVKPLRIMTDGHFTDEYIEYVKSKSDEK